LEVLARRDGVEAAGELVGLNANAGPVWLQVGTGKAPPIDRIRAVVDESYPDVLAAVSAAD
jgi:hypothetical protein